MHRHSTATLSKSIPSTATFRNQILARLIILRFSAT
ncbi:hypothetical protein CGCA056_v012748 [Colletotrichum aenigma]|nr:uncharacterized protein CGCA056_v012748 [Colletotrichum aenigma]KAF5507059.1 hypothetical protein CGCA056_v012748 [Colletotrichum aenigma]